MKLLIENSFVGKVGGISRDGAKFLRIFENLNYELIFTKNSKKRTAVVRKIFLLKSITRFFKQENRSGYSIYWQQQVSAPSVKLDHKAIHIVRLHDIFPLTNPEWFTWFGKLNFKIGFNTAKKSAFFVCNSKSTQDTLSRFIPNIYARSIVIYCDPTKLESGFQVACECQGCNTVIDTPYYISIGTIEPRKNYSSLVASFLESKNKGIDLKLLIVGKYGWKQRHIYQLLRKIDKSKDLIYLEDCCDDALARLLKQATAFVSASLEEGFNIPAVEARNLGVPLLLSDITVHRELHDSNAIFFNLKCMEQIWFLNSGDLITPKIYVDSESSQDSIKMKAFIDNIAQNR
ncbi:MAG: D-inositol 3-phosphate glycosyltransferase [Actinomycetota bacterium]